ncbi:unnamed protein product [Lactuca saligna]|uniref:GST N-terminal domain-containing protein n=1 Tax=Lactuca saligna TaxID=75948 RepID=A0AA35YPV6_LACSI|nr:unnamed protein product [Lactuca saligna]
MMCCIISLIFGSSQRSKTPKKIMKIRINEIDFEEIRTDVLKNQQFSPKYKAINPIHQVPAIVDGRFKYQRLDGSTKAEQWYYEGAPVPEVQSLGRLGPELPGGCRWEYIPSADSGQSYIINKGWGGLGIYKLFVSYVTEPKDFVYSLDNIPHDWLFLQCASVVHRGGAGTTAAGLKVA